MENPFRSEEAAFRFVWLTIGYCGLIVLGSVINVWLGLIVFVVLTAVALWWVLSRGKAEAPVRQAPAASPAGEYRILVVCPALNSPLKHWVSDEDEARTAAQERLDRSLASMRTGGVTADGEIGDGDPIQAIEDALRTFRPDELIVSTHPPGRSHWLERGVVERARERFELPVTHVVVDLQAESN